MTNAELTKEIIDNLTNDSENPGRMVQHLTEDCTWTIDPGGLVFVGLPEIRKFIEIAMASRGGKKSQPTKVTLYRSFSEGDELRIEYGHAFSFGGSVPGLSKIIGNASMKHLNIYTMRDGKISSVHEYASSSFWLLNVVARIMLKRIWKKTKRQMVV
jgi:hypothetical protein